MTSILTRFPGLSACLAVLCWSALSGAPALAAGAGVSLQDLRLNPAAAPAAASHRRQDGAFIGQFADAAGNTLSLHAGSVPGRHAGLIEVRGKTRAVVGDAKGTAIEGFASGVEDMPDFRAVFAGAILEVSLGAERLRLERVARVDPAIADLGPVSRDPARRWTVAIYLAGDNDLEAAAMADLREIYSALPLQDVEVVVLLDRAQGHHEEPGGWTDADIYRYDRSTKDLVPFKALGEINTGDADTLASFFTGVFRTFPAQRHAAFVWNHGGGWTGIAVDEDTGDKSGRRDMLDLREIRAGLRTAVLQGTGRPLDILAFDACLMAQLEVALQLDDLTTYLVASEELVPGEGYPYQAILPLFGDRALAPRQVAEGMVNAFHRSYVALDKPATTLSVLDPRQGGEVAAALDAFTAAAEAGLEQHWPEVARALFYAESYQPRALRLEKGQTPSFDLLDLAKRISEGYGSAPLRQAYTRLEAAVKRMVLASARGDLRSLSHGLSLYAPRTAEQWADAYAGTPLAGHRWPRFVRRVHALAAQAAGPVTFSDLSLEIQGGRKAVRPFNGDRLRFAVTGRSIVQMLQLDTLRNEQDNGWLVLRRTWVADPAWMARAGQGGTDQAHASDLFMPRFKDGRNELAVELTGLQFVISNGGEDAARATLDSTGLEPGDPIVAQAVWYPAGTRLAVPVEVHFDRAWWRVAAIYDLSNPPGIAPRQIQPAKEDEFAFVLEEIRDNGQPGRVLAPRLTWLDGLSLVLTADAPDRYQTALVALTMDGRQAAAVLPYDLEENPVLREWTESWRVWNPGRLPGTWSRELLTGPNTWRDLDSPSTLSGPLPLGPGVFKAVSEFGPKNARQHISQLWLVETRGLPNLRIIQPVEGGTDLVWYGPARLGSENGRLWLAMKAVQVGGVMWRWRQSLYDALKLPAGGNK